MTLFDITNEDNLGIDENKNYFDELVGDGKKFKDAQALARAKAESDAYIKTILSSQDEMRAEMKRLRDEATTKAKLEDLIDRMQNTKDQSLSSNENTDVKEENKPLFDPKAVENRMYEIVAETKRRELEQQNYNTVLEKIKERFGDNPTHLKQKVKELGLTDETVENMAKTMPQVLIRSLGLGEQPRREDAAPLRSSYRTDTSYSTGGSKRDWAYYQKMRKETPELYHSPKITVQRHKDVMDMGERAFYGAAYDGE